MSIHVAWMFFDTMSEKKEVSLPQQVVWQELACDVLASKVRVYSGLYGVPLLAPCNIHKEFVQARLLVHDASVFFCMFSV
jgi:hypothetical protein